MTSLHHTKRSNAGFTLIEIMITVAVIAILAAVALPQYFDYVTRSRLVEAKTNLADMRTRLEQYFLDNRAYPTACVTGATAPPNISLPASQKFFNVTCAFGLAPPTYTVTATDTFSKAPPRFVFTVNEANLRQTPTVAAGWTSSTVCWISKKSGDC